MLYVERKPGPVFIKLVETKFCVKSQVLVSNLRLFLVSNLLAIHKIVETKFSLRFGLCIYLFIWGFTSLSTLYRSYHDG